MKTIIFSPKLRQPILIFNNYMFEELPRELELFRQYLIPEIKIKANTIIRYEREPEELPEIVREFTAVYVKVTNVRSKTTMIIALIRTAYVNRRRQIERSEKRGIIVISGKGTGEVIEVEPKVAARLINALRELKRAKVRVLW